MEFRPLSFRCPVPVYDRQAGDLLAGWIACDRDAVQIVRHNHPRLLDRKVPWKPADLTESELRSITFEIADTRLALARWYTFKDWKSLTEWVEAVLLDGSPVSRYENAVEAVINGDSETLRGLLRQYPELVHARSTRVTPHDPPRHEATLLHYIAANGVEGHRQKTAKNAVEIARILLEAGAEPDALADMYGGRHTTMSMLVSSCHPANAGVQAAIAETLLDFGAALEGCGEGVWTSPLMTALAFGYIDTAQVLAGRGARIATIAAAAGLGRLSDAQSLLPSSTPEDRHKALALAAQIGHVEIVKLLLDAGEDPDRYNPESNHGHSTPLHQAALAGHTSVVQMLVERGARLDIRDTVWSGTPLGWAEHDGRAEIAAYLRSRGASE